MAKELSERTKRIVYKRAGGKCEFCGMSITVDQHHIKFVSKNPFLIDVPENILLACPSHHRLCHIKGPDGNKLISFTDIKDLVKSKYSKGERTGGPFLTLNKNFEVILGSNACTPVRNLLIVNDKPLIDLFSILPTYYLKDEKDKKIIFNMRFFDGDNNYVGGVFGDHFATVADHEWKYMCSMDEIMIKHKEKDLFISFEKRKDGNLHINGRFYFDGILINASEDKLILPGGAFSNCILVNAGFVIEGDKENARLKIVGRVGI